MIPAMPIAPHTKSNAPRASPSETLWAPPMATPIAKPPSTQAGRLGPPAVRQEASPGFFPERDSPRPGRATSEVAPHRTARFLRLQEWWEPLCAPRRRTLGDTTCRYLRESPPAISQRICNSRRFEPTLPLEAAGTLRRVLIPADGGRDLRKARRRLLHSRASRKSVIQ